jgi:hypothetical protein
MACAADRVISGERAPNDDEQPVLFNCLAPIHM